MPANVPLYFFAHANGFPGSSYAYFFECLQAADLQYVDRIGQEGGGPPLSNWQALSRELAVRIRAQGQPVIGIGHSLGAALLLFVARRQPELFRGLILMDPPLFGPFKRSVIGFGRLTGIIGRFPPAALARRRRREWPSREAARAYFSGKALFRHFHPRCFEDYLRHGLEEGPDGTVGLRIPAEQEYGIFAHTPFWLPRKGLAMPSALLYATQPPMLNTADLRALRYRLPGTAFIPVAGGHMFPLEQPEKTAARVRELVEGWYGTAVNM